MESHRSTNRSSSQPGLTLIELIVVLGVLGVLAALLVPAVAFARGRSRTVHCVGNLNALGQAYTQCVMQSNGQLPDAYYQFGEDGVGREVSLPEIGVAYPDVLFNYLYANVLQCSDDDTPVKVLATDQQGLPVMANGSYGYNLALPLVFENPSRIPEPGNTVTFYDGCPSALTGFWQHYVGWAEDSIDKRHRGEANFLYLDGHVVTTGEFPSMGFEGRTPPTALDFEGGVAVVGMINLNPTSNMKFDFDMTLKDGSRITRDDLAAKGQTFTYQGPAVAFRLKPKGAGNQNGLTVHGEPRPLPNGRAFTVSSSSMQVYLYNRKKNGNAKAMGRWWIEVMADNVEIVED